MAQHTGPKHDSVRATPAGMYTAPEMGQPDGMGLSKVPAPCGPVGTHTHDHQVNKARQNAAVRSMMKGH